MNSKSVYKTRQKELILAYLKNNNSKHHTVAEICSHIKNNGGCIGTTTVYRYLDRLVKSGQVQKIESAGKATCFQFIGDGICGEKKHFHLKCLECGELIHMHCRLVDQLSEHIQSEHNFEIQPLRTTFYGVCSTCNKNTKPV